MTTNRITRRTLLGTAAAAAAAPALGACAGAPDGGSGSGGDFTVYWNAGHAYDAYQAVVDQFEKDHGVTVNFQKFQWADMRTRLLSDFASGVVPDVVESAGNWAREFAISGDALSLQKYVDEQGAEMGYPDDWQQGAVDRNIYNGETYGIQMHLTCSMLFYNKEMFAEAGLQPPATWNELADVAKKLTTDDVHGIALNQDDSYSWPWLLQNGVTYYNPDTKGLLEPHANAVEALQFQSDLVHKLKVSPVPTPGTDYSGPQKLLSARRTAMIITGPWDLKPIAETSPDLQLGIAPSLTKEKQATIMAGTAIFVPAKAKKPDLSFDFIKRVTALEVEKAATEEAGMLMPRKSWAADPVVTGNEQYAAFAKGLEYAVDTEIELALTGKGGAIGELYKNLFQSVVMEQTPASEAMEEFLAAGAKEMDA